MTLAQKLRAVFAREDSGQGPAALVNSKLGERPFADRDLDIAYWAGMFGIAFGIARTENPFESDEEVGQRAMQAAWPLFIEFNGPITPAPRV